MLRERKGERRDGDSDSEMIFYLLLMLLDVALKTKHK